MRMEVEKPHPKRSFFLVLLSLAITLLFVVCGEITIRFLGKTDVDGNFSVTLLNHHVDVKPFHLPVNFVKAQLSQYHTGHSYLMYDATLGWVPRPRSSSSNGLYHANEEGIRSDSIDAKTVSHNNARKIVLFGDSYTHGDEVAFEHTFGYYLKLKLALMGIQADIINLGVPAYGMDQAYLRWKSVGLHRAPDFVVFGFQPENVKRNLNLFRKLYHRRAGIPFTKPRFVLAGDSLQMVNSPTIAPEDIADVLSGFESWKLKKYEYFYQPRDYHDLVWLRSKILSTAITGLEHLWHESKAEEFYDIEHTPSRLALAILNQLRLDVEDRGATFFIAALIPKWDFKYVRADNAFPYQDLFDFIKREYHTVETHPRLLKHEKDGNTKTLFSRLHYSPEGNEIIAEAISEAIATHETVLMHPHIDDYLPVD